MLLNDLEKGLFHSYCTSVANDEVLMIKHMEKMGHMPEQMITRMKNRAAAYMIVAADLNTGESTSVSSNDVGRME